MSGWALDIRFALRMLRLKPGFAAAVVSILSLGIAANTTIFSVVNALVFKPLPYKDPERIVQIIEGNDRLKTWGAVSYPNFSDWKSQNQALEEMAVLAPGAVNLSGGGEPERLRAVRVSADLMLVLGCQPALGRAFLPEEFAEGGSRTLLLTHKIWQRRFGSRADVIGQSILIDGYPHSIAGILPPVVKLGYFLGFEPEVWLPLTPGNYLDRGSHSLIAVARLRRDATLENAQANMNLIGGRLEKQYPDTNAGWKTLVMPLRPEVDPIAYALLAILVTSVLGIVCTNVANLLLARAAGRERELAIRSALGAGRLRVIRQLLTEGMLLCFLGCSLGVFIAYWACVVIKITSAGSNLEVLDIAVDGRVLVATVFLFVLTGLMVGLIPSLQMSRSNVGQALKEGSSNLAPCSSRRRLKNIFVTAEIMLSLLLLAGAGIVIKSWQRLWGMDLGYRPEGVLVLDLALTPARYREGHQQTAFFEQLLKRLEGRSEIHAAAVTSALPTVASTHTFMVSGRPKPAPGEDLLARFTVVSAGYFHTMGIALKVGRGFSDQDNATAPPVALINEAMVSKYWRGTNPVGNQIEMAGSLRTIVGVIGNLRGVPLHITPAPEIYVPYLQAPTDRMSAVIKAADANPLSIASAMRKEIQAIDPDQPMTRLETMDKIRSADLGVIKLGTSLVSALAVCALALAAIGIYGVVSFYVSRQQVEFGIRMALGARRQDVLKQVMRQGLRLALAGVIPGMLVAFVLVKVLSRSLYGVSSVEPGLLAATAAILVATTLLACLVPARRATRIDPMAAVRCQ